LLARAILVARASSGAIARSEYVKSALYSRAAAAGAASASSPTERRLSKPRLRREQWACLGPAASLGVRAGATAAYTTRVLICAIAKGAVQLPTWLGLGLELGLGLGSGLGLGLGLGLVRRPAAHRAVPSRLAHVSILVPRPAAPRRPEEVRVSEARPARARSSTGDVRRRRRVGDVRKLGHALPLALTLALTGDLPNASSLRIPERTVPPDMPPCIAT